MHPRRRNEVLVLESVEVGVHLAIKPLFLLVTHGWQRCDDHLRVFEFDQVMELNACFSVAGVVPIKQAVGAGLDLGCVLDLVRVGGGGTGFVVDDFPPLNQVEDAD